jgi:hypothetical protein
MPDVEPVMRATLFPFLSSVTILLFEFSLNLISA